MNGIKRSCLIVAVVVGLISETRDTSAQFSASYQTNIINGVTNNWSGQYLVGVATSNNALLILNGGVLSVPTPGGVLVGLGNVLVTDPGSALLTGYLSLFGRDGDGLVVSNGGTVITRSEGDIYGLGTGSTGTACSATVIGTGSVWSNMSSLYVGYSGAGSSLVIRNGGVVVASQPGLTFVGNDSSSSNTSVLVTDPGSVWSNNANLYVGNGSEGNSLVISNGGKVFSGPAYLGKAETANGNHVEVVGPGSIWFNKASIGGFRQLEVGRSGSGNSLVIDKGGQVFDGSGSIGFVSNSVNNSVWVTDSGSVWSNTSDLSVGSSGVGNTLVISNGGKVFNGLASIGSQASSGSNRVRVVDNGIWQNGEVRVGDQGSSNSLVVGGGNVSATLLTVGLASSTCDNLLELDSGTITVAGPVEIRNGTLILNGGILQADRLVMTNSCASFIHNGGTLIVSNIVLDPNAFRITSIVREGNDVRITWLLGPGQTNALQAAAGGTDGSYHANGSTDIFVVTNTPVAGTVTNSLDVGAATNAPARYYRVRLTP